MISSLLLRSAPLLSLLSTGVSATYQISLNYEGSDFLSHFDYFTGSDPTGGFVDYVDGGSSGLASSKGSQAIIRVDSASMAPGGRKSVRITSKDSFTQGLIIGDISHMPGGVCGTWPAFWTFGPDWPTNGEIDMLEGVNSQSGNLMSLHSDGTWSISGTSETGLLQATSCTSGEGCNVKNSNANSYGSAFNANNGGVFATQWTDAFIKIWFFPAGSVPSDIGSGNPDPAGWGLPSANFVGPIGAHFNNHNIIFDTTFCGQWAGEVWSSDPVCGKLAPTCNDYVANNPSAFADMYWAINSVKVYQDVDTPAPAPTKAAPAPTPTSVKISVSIPLPTPTTTKESVKPTVAPSPSTSSSAPIVIVSQQQSTPIKSSTTSSTSSTSVTPVIVPQPESTKAVSSTTSSSSSSEKAVVVTQADSTTAASSTTSTPSSSTTTTTSGGLFVQVSTSSTVTSSANITSSASAISSPSSHASALSIGSLSVANSSTALFGNSTSSTAIATSSILGATTTSGALFVQTSATSSATSTVSSESSSTASVSSPVSTESSGSDPATIGDFEYLGCYSASNSSDFKEVYSGSDNTPQLCVSKCSTDLYAAVSGTACFCGNSFSSMNDEVPGTCSAPCPGNSTETCGGAESLKRRGPSNTKLMSVWTSPKNAVVSLSSTFSRTATGAAPTTIIPQVTGEVGAGGRGTSAMDPTFTTSTVFATSVYTITSCAATVTDCPARIGQVTTDIISLYTTVCPVTATEKQTPTPTPTAVSGGQSTISTVYATSVYTITSCAATVTDCPARMGQVTTDIISLYTTVCPVTASETPVSVLLPPYTASYTAAFPSAPVSTVVVSPIPVSTAIVSPIPVSSPVGQAPPSVPTTIVTVPQPAFPTGNGTVPSAPSGSAPAKSSPLASSPAGSGPGLATSIGSGPSSPNAIPSFTPVTAGASASFSHASSILAVSILGGALAMLLL